MVQQRSVLLTYISEKVRRQGRRKVAHVVKKRYSLCPNGSTRRRSRSELSRTIFTGARGPLTEDHGDSGESCNDKGSGDCDDRGSYVAPSLVLPGLGDQKLRWSRIRLLDPRIHSATMASIMLDVKVDRSEDIALHDQVAAEIRRAIAAGEASPGERLPPAKDLAAVLGVNSNTVLRALRILRDEGLLEFRRGRGVTVARMANEGAAVIEKVRDLLEFARFYGYRSEDVVEIVQSLS